MRTFVFAAAAAIAVSAPLAPAQAEDPFPPVTDPAAQRECGDCHMVYQPEMLTQLAWRKMFADLSDHFGEDATLAPDTAQQILAYYLANAADVTAYKDANRFTRRIDPANPPLKITDTPRYKGKHRRIAPEVWQRKNVGFKGNCVACHTDAVTKGDYEHVADNLMYQWVEK